MIIFFLYDCYVLGPCRRSKYNYQKIFFYMCHIHFNRKFTCDCPIQHLWNCPYEDLKKSMPCQNQPKKTKE